DVVVVGAVVVVVGAVVVVVVLAVVVVVVGAVVVVVGAVVVVVLVDVVVVVGAGTAVIAVTANDGHTTGPVTAARDSMCIRRSWRTSLPTPSAPASSLIRTTSTAPQASEPSGACTGPEGVADASFPGTA